MSVRSVFIKKLKELGIESSYYYLNVWIIGCEPCLNEFMLLENLSSKWNKSLTNLYITSHSEKQ